jgi:hypothetical protein
MTRLPRITERGVWESPGFVEIPNDEFMTKACYA